MISVQGLMFREQDSVCMVQHLVCGVVSLGIRVEGLGLGVWVFGVEG